MVLIDRENIYCNSIAPIPNYVPTLNIKHADMIFSENIYQMYIEILGKVDCSAFLFTHMIPVLNKRNVLKIQNSPIHTLHSNKT